MKWLLNKSACVLLKLLEWFCKAYMAAILGILLIFIFIAIAFEWMFYMATGQGRNPMPWQGEE